MSGVEEKISGAVTALADHPFVELSGATGSGKSTGVPTFCYGNGIKLVLSVPLRSAAISLARRIAKLLRVQLGDRVGFRTGLGASSTAWPDIMVVTSGWLETYVFHNGWSGLCERVLMLDEFHLGDTSTILTLGWLREDYILNRKIPLTILASATPNSELLYDYVGAQGVVLPGSTPYPITELKPGPTFFDTVVRRVNMGGGGVIAFQPTKARIYDAIDKLGRAGIDALPFHGQLCPREIEAVLRPAVSPSVIVASSAGACSLTLPWLRHVVSSGYQRRVIKSGGAQDFMLRLSTASELAQERGRVGRVQDGTFTTMEPPSGEHSPYGIEGECPEVVILRASRGRHIPQLLAEPPGMRKAHIFHMLSGHMDENGLTASGRKVRSSALSPRAHRLVEEAPQELRREAIAIAVIFDSGGITVRSSESYDGAPESDLFPQYETFVHTLQAVGEGDATFQMR